MLFALSTPPLLVMAVATVPDGFASVPYAFAWLLAFIGTFVVVAVVEGSLAVNLLLVLLFWLSIAVLTVMYPGTAPDRWGRTIEMLWQIGLMACAHAIIQLGLIAVRRRMVPKGGEVPCDRT